MESLLGNQTPQTISPLLVAKWILRCRRGLSRFFPEELFGDPARDMLMHMFVAMEENRYVTVTSCCLASGVPVTTALRHIETLKSHALVEAVTDPVDRRRIWLVLTLEAHDKMKGYLQTVARSRL